MHGQDTRAPADTTDSILIYIYRPPDTAVGVHLEDLPIVVVTPLRDEALKIHALNREILAHVQDPVDVNVLKKLIRASPGVKKIFARTRNKPIYGFKVGKETGIYHPYSW